MANTYTQIYIHVVFAVQGRQNLLKTDSLGFDTILHFVQNLLNRRSLRKTK